MDKARSYSYQGAALKYFKSQCGGRRISFDLKPRVPNLLKIQGRSSMSAHERAWFPKLHDKNQDRHFGTSPDVLTLEGSSSADLPDITGCGAGRVAARCCARTGDDHAALVEMACPGEGWIAELQSQTIPGQSARGDGLCTRHTGPCGGVEPCLVLCERN